jgi:rod shape-determining protein MreC
MSRAVVTSKRPIWITLTVALILHAALISVQTGRRIDTSFIRTGILEILAPAEKLVDRAIYSVGYIWHNYFALIGVHNENERLRAEVGQLKMQIARQNEQILEAARLRGLLTMSESSLGKTVVARVIGSDPVRANQTVTIDKGRTHGVQPDSAVITPEGIVGRVIHASSHYAIVQLIIDSQSGVGVMLRSTRRQGVLRGNGAAIDLEYIDDDNDLKENEEFITSGQDRIYPKGLPVGVITSVGPRRGLFKTVEIRPSADLGRLEEVICVIELAPDTDVIDSTSDPSPQ